MTSRPGPWLSRHGPVPIGSVPSRTRRLALSAALLAALVALPQGAAQAMPGDVIVSQTDATGDVKILPATDDSGTGPGLVARRSIDLGDVTLTQQRSGVRMTVTLRRILTNSKYDQVIEIQMKPNPGSGGVWFLDVAMSGQEPLDSVATYSPDLDGTNTETCPDLTATVDPVAATVSVLVPRVCLPIDPAKIKVFSSLGHYLSSGVGYSLDRMKVLGAYSMLP